MELQTLCPHCGPDVHVDEDGCCATCGCDAMGQGVDAARAELERLLDLFIQGGCCVLCQQSCGHDDECPILRGEEG